MSEPRTCAGCPAILPPPKAMGRRRKWCSDRCRKQTLYSQPCMDCGVPTNGSDGLLEEPRCHPCAAAKSGEEKKIWTPGAVVLAIQEWEAEYGEPPAMPDWVPWLARGGMHDEARAERFERDNAAGKYPGAMTVVDAFGTWNAAIAAAGFEPRAAHGGGGNELRRRSARQRAAA